MRLTGRRLVLTSGVLLLLLTGAVVLASLLGPGKIDLTQALYGSSEMDIERLFTLPLDANAHRQILFTVRLPRIMLALMVGGSLAAAGVAFQALLRNPLAEPYILGVSSGAAFGAILALSVSLEMSFLGYYPVAAASFIGAAGAMFLVYFVARVRGSLPRHTLLLVGVIVNAFFGALIMFITSVVDFTRLQSIIFWLMGSLQAVRISWSVIGLALLFSLLGISVLGAMARSFNLLSLGDEPAAQLGIEVERTKKIALLVASFITAIGVSVAGPIGFVGLIVPHIMRLVVGPDHRLLLPASVLAGALFLLAADTFVRTFFYSHFGTEIPVGVVTAMCGGPFFLFLLKRGQKKAFFD